MSMINKHLASTDGFGLSGGEQAISALKKKYTIPPFSVLNTRDGIWQDRRRKWLALGIQSELGRDVKTYNVKHMGESYGKKNAQIGETSIFDPVLTELMYTWFCPPGGQIVDPFAGGSVRGMVAGVLGFKYWGCDLSKKQIKANKTNYEQVKQEIEQGYAKEILSEHAPVWIHGDSLTELNDAPLCDFVFSCPPYGNLEVYSKDPADISNMDYEEFLHAYTKIIIRSSKRLKKNRFACFVVASFRNKKTSVLYNLPGDTIDAFKKAGLTWYNDIMLVNACGTAPVRTDMLFEKGRRKTVKLHQNAIIVRNGEVPEECKDNKYTFKTFDCIRIPGNCTDNVRFHDNVLVFVKGEPPVFTNQKK